MIKENTSVFTWSIKVCEILQHLCQRVYSFCLSVCSYVCSSFRNRLFAVTFSDLRYSVYSMFISSEKHFIFGLLFSFRGCIPSLAPPRPCYGGIRFQTLGKFYETNNVQSYMYVVVLCRIIYSVHILDVYRFM